MTGKVVFVAAAVTSLALSCFDQIERSGHLSANHRAACWAFAGAANSLSAGPFQILKARAVYVSVHCLTASATAAASHRLKWPAPSFDFSQARDELIQPQGQVDEVRRSPQPTPPLKSMHS
ncbi:hypothetical protein [Rhodococcus sp. BH5]|uniref:hypothetical protein n=1 Tax=Rhodococcus sp. BH5 TaxID=2871702 RepID=UPI0022CDB599|nr:hypothetical protein [Rhodococcus sp. BH5]MCZ9635031.1 hypothetical protein [Rhodococcus sp. BH5]